MISFCLDVQQFFGADFVDNVFTVPGDDQNELMIEEPAPRANGHTTHRAQYFKPHWPFDVNQTR